MSSIEQKLGTAGGRRMGIGVRFALVSLAMASGLVFVTPALAGSLYTWRTDDGGYAFTDDKDNIPARYRDQVESRKSADLDDYGRLTTPVTGSTQDHATKLQKRLAWLRSSNAVPAKVSGIRVSKTQSMALTGGRNAPKLDITSTGVEPIVVEEKRYMPEGSMTSSRATVVRQGGRVVAVLKGSGTHDHSLSDYDTETGLFE